MRRGCVSLGDVQCDSCHRAIPYPERYLLIEETEGVTTRCCTDCCLEKGYAHRTVGKGEPVLTFFPEAKYEPQGY